MSGDGGGGCAGDGGSNGQRVTKRDLLDRIEALEREVRELRARPPQIIQAPQPTIQWLPAWPQHMEPYCGPATLLPPVTAAQGLPINWLAGRCVSTIHPRNTRLEN